MLQIDNSGSARVSVVIPAYNEQLVIEKTLDSLLGQDFTESIELIVANNNSSDNTAELAAAKGARVVTETRKGTRFAYDAGMRAARGQIILATNADVSLPANWISSIVALYDREPETVGIGTKVRFSNVSAWVNRFMDLADLLNPKRGMWGTSLSCRKWVYERVGGFNHGVNTNEDGIFSLLIEKFGQVKYIDDVVVLMDGRRFNQGFFKSVKAWVQGIGLNGLYIQLNYILFGQIKSLYNDFGDIRSSLFGKGEKTQISVIIPVSDDQETIAQTLTSLQQQDFNYRFKIYVIDNFSVDLSLGLARVFPNVQIISYPKIYNFGERLQLMLGEIDSPVIAFTTAQAKLPPDWLSQIYREFNKERKNPLNILSGPYIYENSKLISSLTSQPLDKISGNIEFSNIAMDTATARELLPKKGSLDAVADYVSKEVVKRDLNILYAINFHASHNNSSILGSLLDNSSKTLKHTLRRIMQPITRNLPTPEPQE